MSVEFKDAVREDIRLLILLAGGTGAGKTESAMRVATGLAGGEKFAVIDTENGRALHKADDYSFKHADLDEPFSPERFTEAIRAADAAGFPVIVVDSGSAEYEGVGGILDAQEEEFRRMGRKDSARMASWIEPKARHRKFVQALTRTRAHVILCLRAQDAIDMVKDSDGKTKIVPKESLTGIKGWVPIVERRLPFEATISLMLLQDAPGVPVPIKLEARHRDLIPLDQPLDEATGERLAAWAKGSAATPPAADKAGAPPSPPGSEDAHPSADPSPSGASELLTDEQRDRLDELVSTCRMSGDKLYATAAADRNETKAALVAQYGGSWPELRESLTHDEASSWIARLEAKAPAGAAA